MSTLTLELPSQKSRATFNLRRWTELLADPAVARIEGRVETDRYGHVIMSPPPAPHHGSLQSRIASYMDRLMPSGRVLTECPISTADGVKAADVAWASPEQIRELGNRACFREAPEICVEVLSPGNTSAEMDEKVALYFDAGAKEVWLCAPTGTMKFLAAREPRALRSSRLCPAFPKRVTLR